MGVNECVVAFAPEHFICLSFVRQEPDESRDCAGLGVDDARALEFCDDAFATGHGSPEAFSGGAEVVIHAGGEGDEVSGIHDVGLTRSEFDGEDRSVRTDKEESGSTDLGHEEALAAEEAFHAGLSDEIKADIASEKSSTGDDERSLADINSRYVAGQSGGEDDFAGCGFGGECGLEGGFAGEESTEHFAESTGDFGIEDDVCTHAHHCSTFGAD